MFFPSATITTTRLHFAVSSMGSDSISPSRLRHLLATLFSVLLVGSDSPTFVVGITGFATVSLIVVVVLHSALVFVLALLSCFPGLFALFGLRSQDLYYYLLPIYGPAGQGAILSTLCSMYTWVTTTTGCFMIPLLMLTVTSLVGYTCFVIGLQSLMYFTPVRHPLQ
jgi:hypothetical protein